MTEPKDQPKETYHRHMALASLLVLFGMGGGIAVRNWTLDGAATRDAGGASAKSPFRPAGLSPDASALWNRLVTLLGAPGSKRFTFERLATLLLKQKGVPLAEGFAAEFLGQPELKRAWEEFRHAGESANADSLARTLSDSLAFTNLINKYARQPGFDAVSQAVTRDVSTEIVQSGGSLPIDYASMVPVGGGAAPRAFRGAGSGSAPPLAMAGGNGAGRGEGAGAYGAPAESSAFQRYDAPNDAPAESTALLRTQAPENVSRGDSHLVERQLADRGAMNGNRGVMTAFASLFTKMSKYDRDRILRQIEEGHDIWEACRHAQASEACDIAIRDCQQDPACARQIVRLPPRPRDPDIITPWPGGGPGGTGGGNPTAPPPDRSGSPGNPGGYNPDPNQGRAGQTGPGDEHKPGEGDDEDDTTDPAGSHARRRSSGTGTPPGGTLNDPAPVTFPGTTGVPTGSAGVSATVVPTIGGQFVAPTVENKPASTPSQSVPGTAVDSRGTGAGSPQIGNVSEGGNGTVQQGPQGANGRTGPPSFAGPGNGQVVNPPGLGLGLPNNGQPYETPGIWAPTDGNPHAQPAKEHVDENGRPFAAQVGSEGGGG